MPLLIADESRIAIKIEWSKKKLKLGRQQSQTHIPVEPNLEMILEIFTIISNSHNNKNANI